MRMKQTRGAAGLSFVLRIQLLVYFTLVFTLYFEWSLVYQV